MGNKSVEPQIMVPAREISVITGEIIELRRQANNMLLVYAIEVGRRLVEAKGILPHGEWGKWLKEKVDFSQSTANNLMKLYDEYGQSQLSIFGAVSNSQTIGNLPYSKALQLIAIPENERENFAKEVDAENISVKELKAAIEERNAAITRAEEAEKKASEIAEKQAEMENAVAETEELRKECDKLNSDIAELEKKLKQAIESPEISPQEIKKIKDDATKLAKQEATKEIEKDLAKAKKDSEVAEQKRQEAEHKAAELQNKLTEMQKQLKTANPEIAAFKTLFDEMQKTAQVLKEKLNKIKADTPEVGEKLSAALIAFGNNLKEI